MERAELCAIGSEDLKKILHMEFREEDHLKIIKVTTNFIHKIDEGIGYSTAIDMVLDEYIRERYRNNG